MLGFLIALLLAGCATAPPANVVTFNRTAFALGFGKMSVRLLDACHDKSLDAVTCTAIRANVKTIEKILLTEPVAPAPAFDFEAMAELIGIAIGAAK